MAENTGLAVKEQGVDLVPILMSTKQLLARKRAIQELQSEVMVDGVDFGVIPGCKKPSLFKAGAETLNVTFGLRPVLDPEKDIVVRDLPGGHREYQVTVHILAADSDREIATGVGSCSTMESKYRYRDVALKCPKCGKAAIIKGKEEFGGGWVCWKKKEGCDAKFKDGDPAIEKQERGKVENEDPADQYNTCLKMAKKRGGIDGTINATAASHVFTQDVEDMKKELIKDAEYTESEEKTAGNGDTSTDTGKGQEGAEAVQEDPEKPKQEQIISWAQEMTEGDGTKAEELFVKWTRYIRKDKSLDPGLKNPFDLHGKRLDVTLSRAQKDYFAWKETNGKN